MVELALLLVVLGLHVVVVVMADVWWRRAVWCGLGRGFVVTSQCIGVVVLSPFMLVACLLMPVAFLLFKACAVILPMGAFFCGLVGMIFCFEHGQWLEGVGLILLGALLYGLWMIILAMGGFD